jgi:DNA-binding response OmpR family regulator
MNTKVLIVDDERMLVETIDYNLVKSGFETITAFDGDSALQQVREHKPDLIILDVMLPKVSGWEVCRALRQDPEYSTQAPILMLTGARRRIGQVIGLELGADDYLVKPFSMRELVARVRALLRRSAVTPEAVTEQPTLRGGNIQMDVSRHEVRVQNGDMTAREVKLSLKEFELLRVLLSEAGKTVPRETLLERVWGDDFYGDERTLDVHIRWLREKLEHTPSQPEHILTVRGVGYKFKA